MSGLNVPPLAFRWWADGGPFLDINRVDDETMAKLRRLQKVKHNGIKNHYHATCAVMKLSFGLNEIGNTCRLKGTAILIITMFYMKDLNKP